MRATLRRGVLQALRGVHPDRALITAEFDAAYYLATNPDVAKAGVDPVEHFLASGWREGRDPNPRFSVRDYLETYPDILQADINPFVHFVRTGRSEGRLPRHDLGFRYQVIARLTPVEERVAQALKAQPAAVTPPEQLSRAMSAFRGALANLHITFSHDDFTANVGGVQLCLQREAAELKRRGHDHLHIFPAAAWPVARTMAEPGRLGVLWNGRKVGVFAPAEIARVLRDAAAGRAAEGRSFAIHSLLGHAADETADIVEAAGLQDGFFWLHDFASLCAGFHLLRNDVQDCGAPPPDSAACGICIYGDWRARHLAEHGRLFERLRLTVASPSATALETWRHGWRFPAVAEIIHPHVRLTPAKAVPRAPDNGPFRVAFLGAPATHKGWAVFQALALRHAQDPRYSFRHLGAFAAGGGGIDFDKVSVSAADPTAMVRALEAARIDAALIWPLCRETFSFTVHEAAAAGVSVITNPDSGNVASFVQAAGHGQLLADEDALAIAFESGDILDLGRGGGFRYDLEFSALTLDLSPAGARA